jgi:predicted permease
MPAQSSVYIEAFSNVLPILFLLLVGVGLKRTQFIRQETVQDLKKVIVNITLPALLFLAFSQVALEPQYLLISGSVFAACLLVLLAARLIQPASGIATAYFPLLLTGFEAGMVGYAIYGSVYGQESIFRFGVVDLGQVIFVFFVMVPILERYTTGAQPFLATVKGFFKTPVILGIFAGIVFNQLGLVETFRSGPLSTSVLETVALIGGLTTPLVAIAVGYDMAFRSRRLWKPALTVGIRLAIWVVIGLLLSTLLVRRFLNLDQAFQAAVMTMFILPPPFIIPLFMAKAEVEDRDYVANTLTLATVVTLFAFSVVTLLYPP